LAHDDGGGWALALILLGVGFWSFAPVSWTNAIWYSVQYQVAPTEVHTTNKPSDCDWNRAPLGTKGCHYKAVVRALNATGDLVAGDDAPKYRKDDRTGNPIISWDGGKTWNWSSAPNPNPTVKTVRVEWVKVTE
jgi:hypothetical protein